jgi:hypothetical protein
LNTKARLVDRKTSDGVVSVLVAPPGRVPFLVRDNVYIFIPADIARQVSSTEFLAKLLSEPSKAV